MQSYHIKSKYSPEKYLKKLQKTLGPENTLSSLVKIVTEPHQRIANYWQKIGFNIAGPLVYSYIKFINSIINANFVLQPDTALSLKMPLIFNVCGY